MCVCVCVCVCKLCVSSGKNKAVAPDYQRSTCPCFFFLSFFFFCSSWNWRRRTATWRKRRRIFFFCMQTTGGRRGKRREIRDDNNTQRKKTKQQQQQKNNGGLGFGGTAELGDASIPRIIRRLGIQRRPKKKQKKKKKFNFDSTRVAVNIFLLNQNNFKKKTIRRSANCNGQTRPGSPNHKSRNHPISFIFFLLK